MGYRPNTELALEALAMAATTLADAKLTLDEFEQDRMHDQRGRVDIRILGTDGKRDWLILRGSHVDILQRRDLR